MQEETFRRLNKWQAEKIERLLAEVRVAFMAGFDAGAEDTVDGGRIICEDFKREVTEKAYEEWRDSASTQHECDREDRCDICHPEDAVDTQQENPKVAIEISSD